MRFLRITTLLLSAVLIAGGVSAQPGVRFTGPITANGGAFIHTARSTGPDTNTVYSLTRLISEHPRANISPMTDDNPNAVIFATHNVTASTGAQMEPFGVLFDTEAIEGEELWFLINQDVTVPFADGAAFNIQVQGQSDSVFVHTVKAGNISEPHITQINHPLLNGNPDAIVSVTPLFKNVANDHFVGVWYENFSARWTIFNQDLAAMPVGAKFNVQVLTDLDTYGQHTASVATISGNGTVLDHPLLNGNDDVQFIVTQRWTGAYNNHPIGVEYDSGSNRWRVVNVDGAAMPPAASFNIHITHNGDVYNDAAAYNGGFEAPAPDSLTQAARWNAVRAGAGSKRICNAYSPVSPATKIFANTGECAYLLKGAAGEVRRIVSTGFYTANPADNSVDLFMILKKSGPGTLTIKAKVKLSDGSTVVLNVPGAEINGAYGWKPVGRSQLLLPGLTPVKVKVIVTLDGGGKVYLDDVSSASYIALR